MPLPPVDPASYSGPPPVEDPDASATMPAEAPGAPTPRPAVPVSTRDPEQQAVRPRANRLEALKVIYGAMDQATTAAWQAGSLAMVGWDQMEGDLQGKPPASALQMLERARDECQQAAQRLSAAAYLILSMRRDR